MRRKEVRKNHNGILIDQDAFLDLDIGFIKFLDETMTSDEELSIINKSFTSKPVKQLQEIKWKEKDFLSKAFNFNDKDKDLAYKLFDDYMKTDYNSIIIKSPEVQSINRLITLFSSNAMEAAYCVVLVRNHKYLHILKNRFPKVTFLDKSEMDKKDFIPFARFIIADINLVFKFKLIEFTHITVLSYPHNFMEIDGKKMLLSDPLMSYGVTNEFNIIDPLIRRT